MALEDPEGPSFASDESGASTYSSDSGNGATTTAPSCLPITAETETTNANHQNDPSVLQQELIMAPRTDSSAQLDEDFHTTDSDAEDELDEGPSFVSGESGDSGYSSGSGNGATTTAPSFFSATAETETTKVNSHSDASVLQQEPTIAACTDGSAQLDEQIHATDSDAEDELDEGPSFVSDDSGTSDGTDYTKASLETQDTNHSAVSVEAKTSAKSFHDAGNDSQLSTTNPKPHETETVSVSPEKQKEQLPLDVIDGLNNLIDESDIVYDFYGARSILGLTPEIVMKVGDDLDIGHYSTLDYMLEQQPQLPIPRVHGILRQENSKWTYVFMDRASGETLESKWEFMRNAQKSAVRDQLDAIVEKYRSIPPPPSEEPNAVFGGGVPRRCKDTRMRVYEAQGPISNEDEFNDFLVTKEGWEMSDYRRRVRSYLRSNHRLVMTHADFHPRNIMVREKRRLSSLHQQGCRKLTDLEEEEEEAFLAPEDLLGAGILMFFVVQGFW